MIIGSIMDGLVIDHIPAGRGMELYHLLGLEELDCEVALIKNASSQKYGRKDIIKINREIELDYGVLAFVDPRISINRICGGLRTEKLHPQFPERITNVLRCKNPRCISSVEQELPQVFRLTDRENGVYRCLYCDTKAE